MIGKRQSIMWHFCVLSSVILASFCSAEFPLEENLECGIYGRHVEDENGQLDFTNRAARPGELPWTVMILLHLNPIAPNGKQLENNMYLSDGVLIHPQAVLVSTYNIAKIKRKDLRVRSAGDWSIDSDSETNPAQVRTVEKKIPHTNLNDSSGELERPISILILSSPFELSRRFRVACLPPPSKYVYDETRCILSDWKVDFLKPERSELNRIKISIVPREDCEVRYEEWNKNHKRGFPLLEDSICAGTLEDPQLYRSASGSPLICPLRSDPDRYVLVGIDISKFQCRSHTACVPYQFADVSAVRDWIDRKMLDNGLDTSVYTVLRPGPHFRTFA